MPLAIHHVGTAPLFGLSVVVVVNVLYGGEDAYPFTRSRARGDVVQPVEAGRGLEDRGASP